MKYQDEFRDQALAAKLIERIKNSGIKATLMEVCGTHTVAIFRSGIRSVLPKGIKLLSGPGCPVCVTPNEEIDKAIWLAEQPGNIMVTFGDMLKVPGTNASLEQKRGTGAEVKVIYSPLEAIDIARGNPNKKVIFFGVGFETTTPTVAALIKTAKQENIRNLLLYSVHKLVPPALEALLSMGELKIDGLLLPGHVSTIIGLKPYQFLADKYNISGVVAGFEPLDILQAIMMLIESSEPKIGNQYIRVVHEDGNHKAVSLMQEVFEPADAVWRGLGLIPLSGLKLRDEYSAFDAEKVFQIPNLNSREPRGCACGEVIRGVKTPLECKLFRKKCTPENPVGPCMVSTEGTCAAYYKYG